MKTPRLVAEHSTTFLTYALVGLGGTAIDVGVFALLIAATPLGTSLPGHIAAATVSFLLAVVNNYVWNRRYTFAHRKDRHRKQFTKFFIVSCIGWLLNIAFLTLYSSLIYDALLLQYAADAAYVLPTLGSVTAKIAASITVLLYNYLANSYWTFRA